LHATTEPEQENDMTTDKKIARRKLSLLELASDLLERFSPEFRERHIEAPHTGALVAVDTFFVGVLKGVGKVTCRPPSTATHATPGPGSIPTRCRSPPCT
jgi:hypothetical protein